MVNKIAKQLLEILNPLSCGANCPLSKFCKDGNQICDGLIDKIKETEMEELEVQ